MSEDAGRLEELLARVQRNAAQPRAARAAFISGTSAAATPSAPAHAPAPAASEQSPAYVSELPEFSEPIASFASQPAPVAPQMSAPFDSVDDLLEDPFPASSAPNYAAQPAPVGGDSLEDPMALVSVAATSGVMPVAGLSDELPEELLEDDIVEMSPTAAEVAEVSAHPHNALDDVDLNFDDEDEARADHRGTSHDDEPPASSSRSKVATTMDEALARAAEQMEIQDGREVPLKTPPPESGPQAAMALPAGIHAPHAPDLDELLEADILPVGGMSAAVPTTEQLGQTIDLEDARGPSLELAEPVAAAGPSEAEPTSEEFEVALPQREFGGGYHDNLMPPPEARQDLDAHLQRVGDDASAPESLAQFPSPQLGASNGSYAAVSAPSVTTESPSGVVSMVTIDAPATADFAPELLARPDMGPSPVAKFIRIEAPRPHTFLELLDASLLLGRD